MTNRRVIICKNCKHEQYIDDIESGFHSLKVQKYEKSGRLNVSVDAAVIKRALKGVGTSDKKLRKILCHRTHYEIGKIMAYYRKEYKKDMLKDIESDTSGDYKKLLKFICMPEHYLIAYVVHWALQGVGTKEGPLNDALILANNRQLLLAKQVYDRDYALTKSEKKEQLKKVNDGRKHKVKYNFIYEDQLLHKIAPNLFKEDFKDPNYDFNKKIRSIPDKGTMANDIMDDTRGHYKKTLITMLECDRSEGEDNITKELEEQLRQDAKTLYDAGEKRAGTTDKIFIAILTKRSPRQIEVIAEHYPFFSKDKSLRQAIISETSGNYCDFLVGLTYSKLEYRARKIRKCFRGVGTNDKRLMFLVASCPYHERKELLKVYRKINNRDLLKDIESETSGDYMKTLLELFAFTD